jgi:hypothetical protein
VSRHVSFARHGRNATCFFGLGRKSRPVALDIIVDQRCNGIASVTMELPAPSVKVIFILTFAAVVLFPSHFG